MLGAGLGAGLGEGLGASDLASNLCLKPVPPTGASNLARPPGHQPISKDGGGAWPATKLSGLLVARDGRAPLSMGALGHVLDSDPRIRAPTKA